MELEYPNLIIAFFAGLLSFVSPCVLPLVPAYIGYMSGRATRNVALETGMKAKTDSPSQVKVSRFAMLAHGVAFVLGFTTIFVILSIVTAMFISVLGNAVSIFEDIVARVGGMVIIFFGLHFMGMLRKLFAWVRKNAESINLTTSLIISLVLGLLIVWAFVDVVVFLPVLAGFGLMLFLAGAFTAPQTFWIRFINTLENSMYADTRPEMEIKGAGGLAGSFSMGLIFAAGWTPCIGPLLGSILTVAAATGNVPSAAVSLSAYSLGLGIPFLLAAGLMEGAQAMLRRLQKHMRKIELVSGSLLIIVGLLVATGSLQFLSQSLSSQTELASRIEECGLGFIEGELSFEQASSCLGGSLSPISVGQTSITDLTVDTPSHSFLFELDETSTIDVELAGVTEIFAAEVIILNELGEEVARGTEFQQIDENKYLILQSVNLEAGQYTVSIAGTNLSQEHTFRFRVRRSETVAPVENSAVGSILDLAAASDAVIGLNVGNRAPDFAVVSIEGEDLRLSELQGQVVLVNFWGTWCGPCLREMPEFQQVYEAYNARGFTILALATRGDTVEDVVQFRDDLSLSFPLIVDEGDVISEEYGVTTRPTTIILDQNGVIVFKNLGPVLASQVEEILQGLLGS